MGSIAPYRDGGIFASNPALIRDPLPDNATRLPQMSAPMGQSAHMNNFLDCIRTRQQPICNANVGHRSCSVCHLGNIAIRTGVPLRWNPQEERFVGENAEQGNRHLSRPYRQGYELPT